MIVRFDGRTPQPRTFRLANRGNNNVDTVQFRLPLFDGAAAFLHLKTGGYSDVVRLADGIYTATRTHTQYAGRMEGWIEIQADGDQVWHSDMFVMHIGDVPNDGPQIEQQYPTAIEEALRAAAMITGMGARAETLPAGSEATVRRELNEDGNPIIIFGIPRGRDGGGTEGGGGVDFEVDNNTLVMEDGVLRVNTTDKVETDNTQPITSAGVYTIVGNINALLKSI